MSTGWTEIVPGLWRGTWRTKTNIDVNTYALRLVDGIAVVSPPRDADDAVFSGVDALGTVRALIAPNSGHDLGQAAWQARYPDAVSYAPSEAAPQIAKAKPQLRPIQPLAALAPQLPDGTRLFEIPGSSSGVTAFSVGAGGQRAVYVDESVTNVDHLHGPLPFRVVFWLTGTGPGLARAKVWWWVFAKDKPGIAKALLATLDGATTVLMAHGEPVTGERVGTIRELIGAMT